MTGNDDYVRITVTLNAMSPDAVFLEQDGGEIGGWVPRSCLYGPDETALCHSMIGDQIEIGVREWMAKKKGFI